MTTQPANRRRTNPPAPSQAFEANTFPLDPGLRLLEASAGTGKTFALAQLVLRFISEAELRLQQLLVVTFTEAAAAELRDRIGRRLQAALAGLEDPVLEAPDPVLAAWLEQQRPNGEPLRARLLLALEELDSADITTIHGFCRRTLQRQALEAAQPPGLQLDSDSSVLVQQIAHDYWQQQVLDLPPPLLSGLQAAVSGPEDLADLLLRLDGDPALQLDPLPEDLDLDQPLAGQLQERWSGAWRQLLEQFQSRGEALEQAFRSSAAQWRSQGAKGSKIYTPKPSKNRVAVLGAWLAGQPEPGDYGAVMAKQGAAELLHTYFHPGAFLKEARVWEGSADGTGGGPSLPERPLLEAVAEVVDGPAEALLLHAAHWGRRELRLRRQRSGRLGFSQLLEGLDPGEQPSTPLLEAVAQRYAVALIDEFQDTDPIQWRILSRAFRPESHRLVIVGDPKQAIYRFRGGELATYLKARSAAASAGGISALTANFRSAPPLIAALNGLMAPGLRRSGLAVPAVQAQASCTALDLEGDGLALELLWLGGERAAGEKAPSRTALERELPVRIAAYTARLLERGEAHGLSPDDVCLLVSTHQQAEDLRSALARRGIASRLVSQGDVFASHGANVLQRLLDALAAPGDGRRLRLLAATPLLGWTAASIAGADAERWAALSGRLAQLAGQLPWRGLLGVLGSLMESEGIARLSLEGRLLADLQQCAELVQERLHSDRLGATAAADWLRRLRLEEERTVPDSHQPNSDVVDAAVAVVTVHRSKGLEYPVVICPYLWQAPKARAGGRPRPGVRWQPPDGEGPRLDLHRNSQWGPGHGARQQQHRAELEEKERLAYVAATRAQRLLVLVWGPAEGQQGNPLHPWLFSAMAPPSPEDDPYTASSDADWRQRLEEEIERRQLPLRLRELPAAATEEPASGGGPAAIAPEARDEAAAAPEAAMDLGCGPVPQRAFDASWGRSSYSSWTHAGRETNPIALEEGRETDARAVELEAPAEGPSEQGEGEGDGHWPDDGPLARFPRGSQAGDCLHRILEQLDYEQPLERQRELCRAELRRAGIGDEHLEGLEAGLERLRQLPLGGELGALRLADLSRRQRLNEMNFDLPLAPVRAAGLAAAFRAHPGGAFGAAYAGQLAALPVASRGFLTGSIDLVFRCGQRWWVLDWKSNWLGERDREGQPLRCGPLHYDQASLRQLMATNHYPLQAHLYLVALHRYLRWRLPDYDPSHHLGGYLYVFLRGVPELNGMQENPAAAALPVTPGLFQERPPLQRLLALDQLLAGATP